MLQGHKYIPLLTHKYILPDHHKSIMLYGAK